MGIGGDTLYVYICTMDIHSSHFVFSVGYVYVPKRLQGIANTHSK